jgi:hypothetical protein
MYLKESFSNPDLVHTEAAPPRKRVVNGATCALIVENIEDERSEARILGNVAGRTVQAPGNVQAWLRNVVAGLGSRGLALAFNSEPAGDATPLVASLKLRMAWVSDIHTSKTATTLWHLQLRKGEHALVDADFRGSDTVMNWSSSDGELQRMVDRAFARSLDLMALAVLQHCPK